MELVESVGDQWGVKEGVIWLQASRAKFEANTGQWLF